jgi:uncharacterized membrane protein
MHFPVLSCFLLGETRMQVLLPYVCGIAVLCIGLWYARKHLGPRLGVEALTSLGPIFYALPLAAFGADHFVFRDSIVQIVPSYMPAPMFWVYLVGAGLIAAALAIAVQQQVEPAALSLTAMFAIFELTVHIPNLFREPSSRFIWAVAARDLAFLGGALSLAITQSVAWPRNRIRILTTVARYCIGIPVTFFGVEQILHPQNVPAVPLVATTPAWMPGHALWGYVTGAVFVLAGLCMVCNLQTRRAANWVGGMTLFVVLVVYLPITIANASNIEVGWNYFADTLMLAGSVYMFAETQTVELVSQTAIA